MYIVYIYKEFNIWEKGGSENAQMCSHVCVCVCVCVCVSVYVVIASAIRSPAFLK